MKTRLGLLAIAAVGVLGGALSCGPSTTDARTLWLDSPKDGTLALVDSEPPPF